MTNETLNTMEGEIINEEPTSIYDIQKPQIPPVQNLKHKKQINLPKITPVDFSILIPKFKLLLALGFIIILICLGLIILSKQNQTSQQTNTNTTVIESKPTPKNNSSVNGLKNEVDQFKTDTAESVISKKLNPPSLDLNISF